LFKDFALALGEGVQHVADLLLEHRGGRLLAETHLLYIKNQPSEINNSHSNRGDWGVEDRLMIADG